MNKKLLNVFILTVLLAGLNNRSSFAQDTKEYLITTYGAIGDGKTLNTEAIQKTIDIATLAGGGKVIVPEGEFLTGTIELKSNVEIHMQKNTTLLGSTIRGDYKSLSMKGRPKTPRKHDNSQLTLIVAFKAENISISGIGTIDGQGRALALNIDSLYHIGVIKGKYSKKNKRPSETMRPKLIRVSMCKNVKFSQTTFKNSACWGLSFELCSNLVLDSITVYNRAYWNNDGMDITDSKNVKITNCNVSSADDGICLKSYYPKFCVDSVYIANCTICSGASAIKFGTASYGGFKNITIENMNIFDTYRSAIAIESVDGGFIENVNVKNIVAKNTGNAIFIRLGNRSGLKAGTINNIHISDIKVQVPFIRADINYDLRANEHPYHNPFPASVTGIPGNYVENIILENIEITYPGRASKGQAYLSLNRLNKVPEKRKGYPEFSMFGELPAWGFYIRHVKGIQMKNVTLRLSDYEFRPAFVFDDVKGINLEKVSFPENMNNNQIILNRVVDFEMTPKIDKQIRIME